jgi:hypothetical protein
MVRIRGDVFNPAGRRGRENVVAQAGTCAKHVSAFRIRLPKNTRFALDPRKKSFRTFRLGDRTPLRVLSVYILDATLDEGGFPLVCTAQGRGGPPFFSLLNYRKGGP